jgi:hypothetical protein
MKRQKREDMLILPLNGHVPSECPVPVDTPDPHHTALLHILYRNVAQGLFFNVGLASSIKFVFLIVIIQLLEQN